jgi:hypothetical protein
MKILYPALAIISIGLAACVTTYPDPYPAIKSVDANAVTGCKHIGHFSSSAETPYGLFSDAAREKVMSHAKEEANKLGATTIVLSNPVSDDDKVSVQGQAYICPQM